MVLYDTLDNDKLLALLKESDRQAFAEIYNRFWKRMLFIAYGHCKDEMQAEEMVQEVMISLWERRKTIDFGIKNLDGYLATAIKFKVFKFLHQQKRQQTLIDQHYHIENSFALDEVIEARFLQEYINGIIETLPERCKLVFKYSRLHYKSNADIAEELSISEKAVEANITRALKLLRVNLKDAGIYCLFLMLCVLFSLSSLF